MTTIIDNRPGTRAWGIRGTGRERDVLFLLAQGMTNEQIAEELVVEVSTVKSHVARILPKLGVRSRLQAVVWAYQNRIVAVPDGNDGVGR